MWLYLTKNNCLENLPFRYICAGTTHKMEVTYLGRPHLVLTKASIFELAKFDKHWISQYQSHENIASLTFF